jgi:hypothetical protein
MELDKALTQLQQELARINEAIASLERLQRGAPRRGRPPQWLAQAIKKGAFVANSASSQPGEDYD